MLGVGENFCDMMPFMNVVKFLRWYFTQKDARVSFLKSFRAKIVRARLCHEISTRLSFMPIWGDMFPEPIRELDSARQHRIR